MEDHERDPDARRATEAYADGPPAGGIVPADVYEAQAAEERPMKPCATPDDVLEAERRYADGPIDLASIPDDADPERVAWESAEAPPIPPVWIVIRDADGDIEVDVFTTEGAAREHARILAGRWGADQGATIVREETVASEAWAPAETEDDFSPWFTPGQAVTWKNDGRAATVAAEENTPEDHLVKLCFADGTMIWCPSYEVGSE